LIIVAQGRTKYSNLKANKKTKIKNKKTKKQKQQKQTNTKLKQNTLHYQQLKSLKSKYNEICYVHYVT
jgi:hypothetical protein